MTVDRATILSGLRDVGVTSGDVLLVHSSLRSFGYVTGGAETVIDALLESVGDGGTLLVPTLTFSVLKTWPHHFSIRKTPSTSGRITETLRLRAQALRSRHPVSSAAAIGPQAAYLTADHRDTPCGPDSPYYRLYELGGKVVFFGATLGSVIRSFTVRRRSSVPITWATHPLQAPSWKMRTAASTRSLRAATTALTAA